ncbi:TrbG/VirB9 family P-type conjugative transfer protein [Novosphingobium mangrovi (ex Huang et al. 2023)]|uniref:TrbG/VirB9 family P-type conjugative transfer protein n=1 Tax=Novosphingobium mangrovi (ex Huang et al. 2023) TaxID=2976432 RepID=A0ABT2I6R7_9SPHN|nr:TrbG/VirB9 family P-type conjugative transfer protein [Novosphingobium mangrovi (ex Huang et al. 2023)]MCT2400257.1 TrbG/VirB9 family P-type conjugative transfer protein [Novosphingobium mangrovi (ex Huang et al. 2023)]
MIRGTTPSRVRALASSTALLAPVLLGLAMPAHADDRLVEHAYDEKEVVRIDGKAGIQAAIAFGDGESIENVAVGDSQAWQITPNKRADLLFVKPLETAARTNMTVVTNRHTYFFDLVASPRSKPLYMLRFTYKDEPVEQPAAGAAMASLNPMEQALASGDPLAAPADAASLNFAWKRSGSDKLLPSRVYDDGSATYLLWPEKAAVPAILVLNEKGEEGPVNYAVRGSTIVISEVPEKIILRSGKASAELENTLPETARPSAAMAANTPNPVTAKGN